MIIISEITKYNEISNDLFRISSILLRKHSNTLTNYDKCFLCDSLIPFLSNLNVEAFSLLATITDFSPNDSLNIFYSSLAKISLIILIKFDKEIQQNQQKELENDLIITLDDKHIGYSCFSQCLTNPNPIDSQMLEPKINITNVLNENQFKIYHLINILLHNRKKELIISFINSFLKEVKSSFNIQIGIFYISLLQNIEEKDFYSNDLMNGLISSEIFSYSRNVFVEEENEFIQLNYLRNLIFQFLCTEVITFKDSLDQIFINSSDYPFLFTEHIGRVMNIIAPANLILIINETFISLLSKNLHLLVVKLKEPGNNIYRAWSTLIIFCFNILNNYQIANLCFKSFEFTNIYLKHLFHPYLKQNISDTLKQYLTHQHETNDFVLNSIAQFCYGVFSHAIYKSDEYHELAIELLSYLEDSMKHNQEIVKYLSILAPTILSFFLHYPSVELLKYTLDFHLNVSFNCDEFKFSSDEMVKLGNTIKTMESNGLSKTTFDTLLSLLAGTKVSSLNSTFVIRNSSYILLILISASDDILPIIKFFWDLCKYSVYNCIQCNKGELDLFLIELLLKFPKDFKFMDCNFKSNLTVEQINNIIIPLLSLIFTYQCSPQSAERFIKLAIPRKSENEEISNENKKNLFQKLLYENKVIFPIFSNTIIDQIIRALTDKNQLSYVYTKNSQPLIFKNVKIDNIENGFTFCCYIMLDKALTQNANNDKPLIFEIVDQNGKTISLYTNGLSLLCELCSYEGTTSISLSSTMPSCEWLMITLSFNYKPNILEILFSFNNDQFLTFKVKNPELTGPLYTVQIGGFFRDVLPNGNIYCFLGSFYLYPITFDETMVNNLYSCGDKIFNDLINLIKYDKCSCQNYIKTFPYVFNEYHLIDSILPFFSFANYAPEFFIDRIIDLFSYIDNVQCEKYYKIISQYMLQFNSSILNYSIYLRFFKLFAENNSLILFKYILFNFEIWCNSPNFKSIVSHYNQVLLPNFPNIFMSETSFSEIFNQIRIYLWFTDIENEYICTKRFKDIDIESIREIINRFLVQFATLTLTKNDINNLLSHIYTLRDIKQKISLLNLLLNIIPLINDKKEVLEIIFPMLTNSRCDIFSLLLEIILRLSEDNLSKIIEYIFPIMNELYYTIPILKALLNISNEFPEVIPICCLISVNLTFKEQKKTLKQFKVIIKNNENCKRISKILTWYIWPIVLTLKLKDDLQNEMINIIFQIMIQRTELIDDILAFLDLFYIHYHINVSLIQFKLIEKIMEHISLKPNNEKVISYMFYRCARYLLFNYNVKTHSNELMNLYINSVFYDQDNSFEIFNNELNISSIIEIEEMINKPIKNTLIFRYEVDYKTLNVMQIITNYIIELEKYVVNEDQTIKNLFLYLKYINNRQSYDNIKRYTELNKISRLIFNYIQVMKISFKSFIINFTNNFKKILITHNNKSQELLSNVKDEIIQISLKSISTYIQQIINNSTNQANYYLHFSYQNMNNYSIWKNFSQPNPLFIKKFGMNGNFYSTLLKPKLSISSIEIEQNNTNINPIYTSQGTLIKLYSHIECTFILLQLKLLIISQNKKREISIDDIKYILYKNSNCFEICLNSGKSYLIHFHKDQPNRILKAFNNIHYNTNQIPLIQNLIFSSFINQLNITNDWIEGKLSNFEYISKLNFFGGKSICSIKNYPIFPFLELKDHKIRDFNKIDIGYNINPKIWLEMFGDIIPLGKENNIIPNNNNNYHLQSNDLSQLDSEFTDSIIDENNDEIVTAEYFQSIIDLNHYELTYEFFSSPECFSSINFVNTNKFKFVYNNRKLLESKEVTENINIWIDNIFGFKKMGKNQLFNHPHPQKILEQRKKENIIRHFSLTTINVLNGEICSFFDDKIIVKIVSNESEYLVIAIDLENPNNYETKLKTKIPFSEKTVVDFDRTAVLLAETDNAEITVVKDNGYTFTQKVSHSIDFCGYRNVFGAAHGTVFSTEIKNNSCELFGFCKVSPEIALCAYSSYRFNITVVGIQSNKILIFDRLKGLFIREIDGLKGAPKHVIITPIFGFIVVHTIKMLSVYSINGELICQHDIDFDISCWSAFRSADAFDYVLIADTIGRVFVCEAFNLDTSLRILYQHRSSVISMKINNTWDEIAILTQEGKGTILPFD